MLHGLWDHNEEYFEELEDILIMADIGVNTVMNFIDRLKKRVKEENITDFEYIVTNNETESFQSFFNKYLENSKNKKLRFLFLLFLQVFTLLAKKN